MTPYDLKLQYVIVNYTSQVNYTDNEKIDYLLGDSSLYHSTVVRFCLTRGKVTVFRTR